MLFAIDVGNTNITIGIFDEDNLINIARLTTERNSTSDQFAYSFLNLLKLNDIKKESIDGAIMCSVVPECTHSLKNAIIKLFKIEPIEVAPGIKTGINIKIDDPSELGADLAAGAAGIVAHYPLPAFVVDLGTATKVYVIDKNKSYLGGMIAPGIKISMDALANGASLLSAIPLHAPKKSIGTDTVGSIQSGVVFGTADMIDGTIDRFLKEAPKPKTIVATGGLSNFIIKECRHKMINDPYLVLKGLKYIYNKNI